MAGRFKATQVSTGPDKSPHKSLILGPAGVGKTYLVSTITADDGSTVFFIPVEEGTKGHSPDAQPAGFRAGDRWIAPRTLAELLDMLDTFALEVNELVDVTVDGKTTQRRPFRHLAIDSISGIEKLVHETAAITEGARHMEDKDYRKVWTAALPIWEMVQSKLDDIRRTGVHIWVVAHATETVEASQTTGEIFRKWDLLLRGSNKTLEEARHLWRSWADNIFFITKDVSIVKGDKSRRAIATLGGRVLITRETGTVYAKSRLPLPARLPATWRDLQGAMRAGVPERVDRTRAKILEIAAQLEPTERAAIEKDLADAKTPTLIASTLSRALGMFAMLEDDEPGRGAQNAGAPVDDAVTDLGPAPAAAPVSGPGVAAAARAPSNANGAAAHRMAG